MAVLLESLEKIRNCHNTRITFCHNISVEYLLEMNNKVSEYIVVNDGVVVTGSLNEKQPNSQSHLI